MSKLTILGAAALLASTVVIPAVAHDATSPGRCDQYGNCQQMGAGSPHMRSSTRHHHAAYRASRMPREAMSGGQREATSPGGSSESYAAYNGGFNSWDHRTWAQKNQFVCTPGTYFKSADGQQHLCQ